MVLRCGLKSISLHRYRIARDEVINSYLKIANSALILDLSTIPSIVFVEKAYKFSNIEL